MLICNNRDRGWTRLFYKEMTQKEECELLRALKLLSHFHTSKFPFIHIPKQ